MFNTHISSLNLDMSIGPFSGRNPSYCFVDLDDNGNADAAISQLQGHVIRGRPIKINYDTGKRAKRPRRIETRLANGERRAFDFSPTAASPLVFDPYARTDTREHWARPISEGRRLYVGGLSDISNRSFVNEEMRQLFNGYSLQAVSKRILPAHRNMAIAATGQCYCFVDLSSATDAEDAMAALNGTPTPYSGWYRINIATDQRDRKVCREQARILGTGNDAVAGDVKRNLDGNWRSRM
jgi:RNA recognition motif-containing protein